MRKQVVIEISSSNFLTESFEIQVSTCHNYSNALSFLSNFEAKLFLVNQISKRMLLHGNYELVDLSRSNEMHCFTVQLRFNCLSANRFIQWVSIARSNFYIYYRSSEYFFLYSHFANNFKLRPLNRELFNLRANISIRSPCARKLCAILCSNLWSLRQSRCYIVL